MTDGFARGQMKFVVVVEYGVVVLVGARVEAIGLAVRSGVIFGVMGVLAESLKLVIVSFSRNGGEICRVERGLRAVSLPPISLFGILSFAVTLGDASAASFLFFVAIRFGIAVCAAEVIVITDSELLGLSGVRDLAVANVLHVGLNSVHVGLDLLTEQAFQALGDLELKLLDESIQVDKVLLLGDEHAVEALHVVGVEWNSGGFVVAEDARAQAPVWLLCVSSSCGSSLFGVFVHGVSILVGLRVGGALDR